MALSLGAVDMLDLLKRYFGDRPLTAVEIAEAAGVCDQSDRETKRRAVRKLASELRSAGFQVCACGHGYWLARDAAEWGEYQAARQSKARFVFKAVRQMADAASDRACGQGELFSAESGADWATAK